MGSDGLLSGHEGPHEYDVCVSTANSGSRREGAR